MKTKLRIFSLPVLSVLILGACSSSPPKCSDSAVNEVLSELLREQANIMPILFHPLGKNFLVSSPQALMELQQDNLAGAFEELEQAVSEIRGKNKTYYSSLLESAKRSDFEISGMTTLDKSNNRSRCEFTVTFHLEFPAGDELLEEKPDALDALKTITQRRTFDTYLSDEGDLFVDLAYAD